MTDRNRCGPAAAALAALLVGTAAGAQSTIATLPDLPGHQHYARVSPDGRSIAFSWLRPGDVWQIFVQPIDGSSVAVQLTRAAQPSRGAAWSPDGKRLVFERGGELWTVAADGSAETRIDGAVTVASFPDWAPDGRQIVYGTGTGTETFVAIVDADGGTPRQVTTHTGGEWFPRWSPDGRRIAFYSTWDGRMTDIWTIAADGTDLVRITDHASEEFRPAWSPDGEWILYTSRRGGKNDLWIARSDGAGDARPITDAHGIVLHADWTREGRILFGYYPSAPRLYAIDVASGDTTALTSAGHSDNLPAFSPDGRELAFTTTRFSAEPGIASMDWSTREVRRVFAGDGGVLSLAWSPDGRRLAFVYNAGGYLDTRQLWVVARDGSSPRQLTTSGDVRDPAWTPDGARIEYRSRGEPWRVAPEGGAPERIQSLTTGIADTAGLTAGAYGVRRDIQGRRAFLVPGASYPELLIAGADGTRRTLARGLAIGSPPTWSGDGRHIVVSVDPGEWILSSIAAPPDLTAAGSSPDRVAARAQRGWPPRAWPHR